MIEKIEWARLSAEVKEPAYAAEDLTKNPDFIPSASAGHPEPQTKLWNVEAIRELAAKVVLP